MSRDRRPHVAQGTWRSGSLHIWGWNGDSIASAAWLYSGFGHSRWSGADNGWHDTPVSYGEVARLDLDLPELGRRLTTSVRLDPFGTAVWLSDTPAGDELSPSLAWFAQVSRLAVGLVSTGHIVPVVVDEGPFTVARWRPVLGDELTEYVARLHAAAPPICLLGTGADTTEILAVMVDGVARAQLHHSGWRPDLGRQRAPNVQACRAVFTALAVPDPVIRSGSVEFHDAVSDINRLLHRHVGRLEGTAVVRPRVRLTVPADPGDAWLVDLELYDDLDSGRWCAASDVWLGTPVATELAGGDARLTQLETTLRELATTVAANVPALAGLADEPEPVGAELDLEAAGDFLDVAPHELARHDIELIGPEHLVRAKVGVRGTATPAPPDDRTKKFAAEALVQWGAVVDDTELSETELARITASGATLMHTGHRWVRIDPAGLRRARTLLEEHQTRRSRVGALELLRLASGVDASDDEVTTTVGPDRPYHGHHDDGQAGGDGDGEADGDGDHDDGIDDAVSDWVYDLIGGLPDEQLEEVAEPPGFVGELRHYQRRGLAWLRFLARLGLGGCLADDMGLGKTATTLAHLVDRPGPHLVVCPLSVVHNWEAEAARFTPGLTVAIHHGAARHRSVSGNDDTEPALFETGRADVVVTTYGLLARDPGLAEIEWATVVLDEAQMVKNPATKAARAVRRLQAGQKLALTGTPVENRLAELWAILDAVNPGLLGSQQRFRERFGMPIERHNDGDAAEQLRRLTRPFVLRRTKADKRLLPDLPDKLEQIAYAQLTREQAVLYQQVVDQLLHDADETDGMQRRGRVLAALTRLKQICNHPAHALKDGSRLAGRSGKLSRFDELVAELLDLDERALVFTQFREMGELLQTHVRDRFGFDAPFLHGGVARGGREAMVRNFQDGVGPPLLLVSLKAGGTGLNLTAASQVIHYDRWWNPAVEDQATDRAWRIGQVRTVNVHKLVCQGTVEERIGEVIDEKRSLADAVVGSGEAWLSELSTDQLRDLVMLDRDGRER